CLYRKHQAAARDFAINQYRTCAANAMLTTKMGPCEFKLLADEISQMLAGIDQSAQLLAVDDRFDCEFVLHPSIIPKDTPRSTGRCRTVPNAARCVNPRSGSTCATGNAARDVGHMAIGNLLHLD